MLRPTKPLRLGTRASPLALAQAHLVRDTLCAAHDWPTGHIEICPVIASGDRILDRPLSEVGGKALWTKELDHWLLSGDIDFAVHSMKDVETIRPPELSIAAMLPRGDVRDRLLGALSIAALPVGAKVGTSAPRRTAQLLALRPDLKIVLFRGNVATRMDKLAAGAADATLLAAAGLDRLGLRGTGNAVPVDILLPAPQQGAIGIETLHNNWEVKTILAAIDHEETHLCVASERAFLAALNADCQSPVAALAQIDRGQIHLRGEILSLDGRYREAGDLRFVAGDENAPRALALALLSAADPVLRACFR